MIIEAFTRVFVDADALERTSSFYQELLGGTETLRFTYPEKGLELAAVTGAACSILIIAGDAESRRPYEATRLTLKVGRLEPVLAVLLAAGAEQLDEIRQTPVGRNMRFRHGDGLVVEYVDHRDD
ncbi:MAG: hypothetical protein P4L98_05810 [Ancalomicrobiaceae bacterium]|nr:hypothetical protein [Ancalomicrobiaceae bacterium]